MRILILSPGADTGGQGFRIKEAFERHSPGDSVRAVAASTTYLHFPMDARWDYRLVENLFGKSDVVHVKTSMAPYKQFDRDRGKPVLYHHHGTMFREAPRRALEEADLYHAVTAVSTHDLMRYRDDIRWLPSPQDADALLQLREESFRPGRKIRIFHSPTNRRVKSTEAFLRAGEKLEQTHNVELVIAEGRPWKEILFLKAAATDIYYDQLTLGYGQNALEAWSMGIPVVAGMDDETAERTRAIAGDLPFYRATEETLYERLAELVENEELRTYWGDRGHFYVRRFHDYPAVVPLIRELYEEAIDLRATRGVYQRPRSRRGERRRLAPGVWERCVRDGMWARCGPKESAQLEAEYTELGTPLETGVRVAEALGGPV